MLPIDYAELADNLRLTQIYCGQQLSNSHKNPAQILRSINPVEKGKEFFDIPDISVNPPGQFAYFPTQWGRDPYMDGTGSIDVLFAEQMRYKKAHTHDDYETPFLQGEVFAFKTDETLIDGAACVESMGLLDDYNCPPIDTWFYRFHGQCPLLLAWIPDQFVPLIQNGIDVNPEECIQLFKHWYPDEYMQLREMGVVR